MVGRDELLQAHIITHCIMLVKNTISALKGSLISAHHKLSDMRIYVTREIKGHFNQLIFCPVIKFHSDIII